MIFCSHYVLLSLLWVCFSCSAFYLDNFGVWSAYCHWIFMVRRSVVYMLLNIMNILYIDVMGPSIQVSSKLN